MWGEKTQQITDLEVKVRCLEADCELHRIRRKRLEKELTTAEAQVVSLVELFEKQLGIDKSTAFWCGHPAYTNMATRVPAVLELAEEHFHTLLNDCIVIRMENEIVKRSEIKVFTPDGKLHTIKKEEPDSLDSDCDS